MTKQLDIEVAERVCRITFRRPEAFNALSEEMARGLVQQLVDAEADDAIRVLVVTGSGSAFSAGADLTGDNPVDGFGEETMDGANLITRSAIGLGKPVVARSTGSQPVSVPRSASPPTRRSPRSRHSPCSPSRRSG